MQTTNPDEAYTARLAAARAEREAAWAAEQAKADAKRAKADARKAAKAAQAKAAHDAEQARVASLTITGASERQLYDKAVSPTTRVQLVERTLTLSDGTTTTRWAVIQYAGGGGYSYGEDEYDDAVETEYTMLADARWAYQRSRYEAAPRQRQEPGPSHGPCAQCGSGRGYHQRRDSSGIAGYVCGPCNSSDDCELSFA